MSGPSWNFAPGIEDRYNQLINNRNLLPQDMSQVQPFAYYPGQTVAPVSPYASQALNDMGSYRQGLGGQIEAGALGLAGEGMGATSQALRTLQGIGAGGVSAPSASAMMANSTNASAPALFSAPTVQAAQLGQAALMAPVANVQAAQQAGLRQATINQVLNNPALQGQIDASSRDVARNLLESELPGAALTAAGAGGSSSSRRAVMDSILARGAQDRIGDIASTLRGQAYNQGVGIAANQAAANQQATQQANLANQQAALNVGQLNQAARNQFELQQAQLGQQANLANQQAAYNTAALGYQGGLQTSLANAEAANRASLTNAQLGTQASLANADNALRASLANQQSALGAAQLQAQIGQNAFGNLLGAGSYGFQNMGNQLNAGLTQQSLAQQQINADVQRFNYLQQSPLMTYNAYLSALGGAPASFNNQGGGGNSGVDWSRVLGSVAAAGVQAATPAIQNWWNGTNSAYPNLGPAPSSANMPLMG